MPRDRRGELRETAASSGRSPAAIASSARSKRVERREPLAPAARRLRRRCRRRRARSDRSRRPPAAGAVAPAATRRESSRNGRPTSVTRRQAPKATHFPGGTPLRDRIASRWRRKREFRYTFPFGGSGRESGGIGRRTGLRSRRGSPWGFESPLSHHDSKNSKDSKHMQTSLETIGQLERRLNMAVPLAEIESEVDKRLARLAKNVKVAGLPSRQGADEDGRRAVRRPGALRRHLRRAAVDVHRRGPRAEPARRRQSAHRAASRTRRRPTSSSSRPCSRSIRKCASAISPTSSIERPVAEVGPADVDQHARRAAQAAHALRAREPRRGEGRSRDRRFHGPHRRRRISGRAGEGFRDRHRRGGDAARVRDGGHRHRAKARRRRSGSLFPPTTTARKSPESTRNSR